MAYDNQDRSARACEDFGASIEVSAASNQLAIQSALNAGGLVSLMTPGSYAVTSDTFSAASAEFVRGPGVHFTIDGEPVSVSTLDAITRAKPYPQYTETASKQSILKPSKAAYNLADTSVTLGTTAVTATFSKDYQRWSEYTRACSISSDTAAIAKGTVSITLDADDLLAQLDMYIPFMVVSPMYMTVTFCNSTGFTANYTAFSFDSSYLKQGWNSLRMWSGDTAGAAGTGTLARGASKTVGGTGCDMSGTIQYVGIDFSGMNGKTVYLCSIRRGAKTAPCLVMGFDATGTGTADDVFIDSVAPLFETYGCGGYFTVTHVYDMLYAGGADYERKHVLYNRFGWDALNHFWNHGATTPGRTATVTLSRTSNLVTATFSAAHGYTTGAKFYANISGASPSDLNGQYEMTAASATTVTYSATGVNGAGTGTILLKTLVEAVIDSDTALNRQIMRHEIGDMARYIKAEGWTRAAHIGAYPNNSVGDLTVTEAICAESGVKYFRGSKGGTCVVTEFGVINPLHIGSVEMGSGSTATTLDDVKNALAGAIGRGESLWTYGHYILDETSPANATHASANTDYPPGSNGNPNPPVASLQGGIGGWWYLGSLRRFITEAVVPYKTSHNLRTLTPAQWAALFQVI